MAVTKVNLSMAALSLENSMQCNGVVSFVRNEAIFSTAISLKAISLRRRKEFVDHLKTMSKFLRRVSIT